MQLTVHPKETGLKPDAWQIIWVSRKTPQIWGSSPLSKRYRHLISVILEQNDHLSELGHVERLYVQPGIGLGGCVLIGIGSDNHLSAMKFRQMMIAAAKEVHKLRISSLIVDFSMICVIDRNICWMTQAFAQIFLEQPYKYREGERAAAETMPEDVLILGEEAQRTDIQRGIDRGVALAQASLIVRRFADTPGNICTPTWLADRASELSAKHPLKCHTIGPDVMQELGMGLLLGVSQGSIQEPRMIVLEYQGGEVEASPVVLIGKGITFDAGGISLKPALHMGRLKYDMSGGATVIGAILTAALAKLPINVVAVIPAAENLPDGKATKPGDVHVGMSGLSVEILNTDAEGRLALADALTYADKFHPDIVIDIATLTRARFIALGAHACALYSNDKELSHDLCMAGEESLDRIWPMPLWEEYHEELQSQFADLANIGGDGGGSITAACFLSRFAERYRWAHIDGGGMFTESAAGLAPHVPLLAQYLFHYADTKAVT